MQKDVRNLNLVAIDVKRVCINLSVMTGILFELLSVIQDLLWHWYLFEEIVLQTFDEVLKLGVELCG